MNFGDRIIELRESRGITRKELAKTLNVSAATITRYEKNDRKPNIEKLVELSNALCVSMDDLF